VFVQTRLYLPGAGRYMGCMRNISLLIAALTSASCASPAPPPATPAETRTLDHQENDMTAFNKALVQRATTELFIDKDITAIERHWAEPYLQHNPQVPSGLEPLRQLVKNVVLQPGFRYQPVRLIASGDLVAAHGRYIGFAPEALVAIDIFRVENGKIVEHWDSLQPEPGQTVSGHTMLDGPTEIADRERTAANEQLVTRFLDTILVRGQLAELPSFIDGDRYVQHNPSIGDGLSGLGAFVGALQEQKISFSYTKVHRVVAEGDFVLAQSEGEIGGKPTAFYDIWRVENGKLAEHWDVIQPIPEQTASGLGLF
jgi:predicted SnoaL-like aldol condensation-catalyzing enzyme